MTDVTPAFIAVDWGTTRLRATLADREGRALARREAETGVQSVAVGGFPAALDAVVAPWREGRPDMPVLMAGMVGSRNGWQEAAYASCPCGPDDLAAHLLRLDRPGDLRIIPGVDVRWPDGAYDVMRGEEVQAFGAGIADGLICLPGTHSKWIEMAGGRIVRFATFITGELYAAIGASFVGRLAEAPHDEQAGVTVGTRLAAAKGGLGRLLFQARAQVLGGGLSGQAVRPFLSGLIVGEELNGGAALFGTPRAIGLVAASPQREVYAAAFAERNIAVTVVDPAEASLKGIGRLAAHVG